MISIRNFNVTYQYTAVGLTTRPGLDDFSISTFPDQLWGQSSLPFSGYWGLISWRQSDRGVGL